MVKTKSNNSGNPDRKPTKGNMRSKSTILRLNMLNGGHGIYDKQGKLVGGEYLMNNRAGGKEITGMARIAPDRRWFGNTRVISQNELDTLREQVSVQNSDPYAFVLRRKKIPMSLLQDDSSEAQGKVAKMNVLETESYENVFGKKKLRKRPNLSESVTDYESLMKTVSQAQEKSLSLSAVHGASQEDIDRQRRENFQDSSVDLARDDMFAKGQSKRIWGELYKVLDSSDVVIQVLDARNIPGTRCAHIEKHLKKNASHKQLINVVNKCDLVPSWAVRKWIKILSEEHPTLAFHATINNSFGKGALITLLRQYSKLHSDKRQISVGIIGYPNTGKSSIINTLKGTKCCKAAPVPGETKVWQYVTLTKKIYLIDSPGIVYDVGDDETETVLKGVVRSERLKDPVDFVAPMLARARKEHLQKLYGLQDWTDELDFLTQIARAKGKLLPSGEPDMPTVAKMMINDWQRGKIPFFVPPPRPEGGEDDDESEGEEDGNGEDAEEMAITHQGGDADEEEEEEAEADEEAEKDAEHEEDAEDAEEEEEGEEDDEEEEE